MKPSAADIRQACPEVDERLVAEHLSRLGEEYFDAFSLEEVCRHLRALERVTPDDPVQVQVEAGQDGLTECVVLAFDYPSEFSLITGALAGSGFSILSGNVFTYRPALPPPSGNWRPRARGAAASGRDLYRRRRIVDHFSGERSDGGELSEWAAAFTARLTALMRLLEQGGERRVTRAKHVVNEAVARRLEENARGDRTLMYPVELDIDNEAGPYTSLRVVSQDTPGFLYALSNALALQGISIESVRIQTIEGTVRDDIGVLDAHGRKIEQKERLDEMKLSVLLTKQFTYFLSRAPDPYAALSRFERMTQDVLKRPERGQWLELFSDPQAFRELAKLLGTSDFIWEDFVRTQYESLLPILSPRMGGRRIPFTREALSARMIEALAGARTFAERRLALNAFKDREIFLVDLDHILQARGEVRSLAQSLTMLAEIVVRSAAELVQAELARRFGVPRTVGGIEARAAVFGLGKLGGEALGYASDIELLFVYSDNGRTDGPESIENAEFFARVAEGTAGFIEAKREGIFRVDLRLRPHGDSGPKACSLARFCSYYDRAGDALAYERLALVRMRAVAGDAELGRQVERLRDEFVYAGGAIDMDELRRLRGRQFAAKATGGRYNAKFSPGALVDLEYYVQILQVQNGAQLAGLRTPRIHEALHELGNAGVLDTQESRQLTDAYYFLRRVINGMRMLRGNALDLFLPPQDSSEYGHLARRMGYERGGVLDPEQKLHLELQTHTAVVRTFVEKHFGRKTLPDPGHGNLADLVLSADAPPDMRERILSKAGFADPHRAYVNLRKLAGEGDRRSGFARLAVLAFDGLHRSPNPDMALNNWQRFVDVLPDPHEHFGLLLFQPKRLEILLTIFAASQFLADTLVRNPDFLDWVTDPERLHGQRDAGRLADDFAQFAAPARPRDEWLNALRRFRRREILRIATRDIFMRAPIEEIMGDLSALAECLIEAALRREWRELRKREPGEWAGEAEQRFCILALGKLGGCELNYSSDIDLLGVFQARGCDQEQDARRACERVLERVRAALSDHTEEGHAYRVDFRLRPHGDAGALVPSVSSLLSYYGEKAALWELQALLKVRPVAGSPDVGAELLNALSALLRQERDWSRIAESVRSLRARRAGPGRGGENDLKTGMGGIRDVEFLVQGLQLRHACRRHDLFTGHTLHALRLLERYRLLDGDTARCLREDYVLLRRIEHYLQVLDDRQIHSLPQQPGELTALARRIFGPGADADHLLREIRHSQERIQACFEHHTGGDT